MKDYTCTHCGGQINPQTMKCEYCGTQYKIENDQILRIETFHNPVETFSAAEVISREMILKLGPENASEYAMHHLASKLAECISTVMQVTTKYDYNRDLQMVRGTVKFVRPENLEELLWT